MFQRLFSATIFPSSATTFPRIIVMIGSPFPFIPTNAEILFTYNKESLVISHSFCWIYNQKVSIKSRFDISFSSIDTKCFCRLYRHCIRKNRRTYITFYTSFVKRYLETALNSACIRPITSNTFSILFPRISLNFSSYEHGEWSLAIPLNVPSST